MPGHRRSWFQRTGTTMTSQTVTSTVLKQWCKGDSYGCPFVTSWLTSQLIARLSNLQTVAGHIATALAEAVSARRHCSQLETDKEEQKQRCMHVTAALSLFSTRGRLAIQSATGSALPRRLTYYSKPGFWLLV
ncbi:hypothetical protein J6590_065718 [Homalodisca vitripennis]|nr:hypothetical protein J6590_065718 [Homalodisca vitripennis]